MKLGRLGMGCYVAEFHTGQALFLDGVLKRFPEGVVFDVGANVGDYSRLIHKKSPGVKIFAFEPNPPAFAKSKTLESDNVRVFNFGCGAKSAQMEIFDYDNDEGSGHATLHKEVISNLRSRPAVGKTVEIKTLDEVSGELGIEKINLLKIDTEGHEYEVLVGAKKLIESNGIDIIHFEFNIMNVVSRVFMKDFYDLLPNYQFYRILRDGLRAMGPYKPSTHENFMIQDIVAIRKGVKFR
jgi:FkbM family methyltransferase